MTKSHVKVFRERMAILNRRIDHLDGRIASYEGKNSSFDKAEASALRWAIRIIEEYPEEAMSMIHTGVSREQEPTQELAVDQETVEEDKPTR